jgi:hypothetical protein
MFREKDFAEDVPYVPVRSLQVRVDKMVWASRITSRQQYTSAAHCQVSLTVTQTGKQGQIILA